ncbi:MAG: metal-sulfur cluster assembly factor [Chloroflexota bacterium]|nr:metal-sulfur cluster assembly factor [Chloroflexota bacterium]
MTTKKQVGAEEVTDALKDVYDPEIPVNIVDLGLVYSVDVDEASNVSVKMTLTAAGCGMGHFIAQQAEWAVADVDGVNDVSVEVVFEPPWSPDLISEEGKKLLGIDD